MKKEGPYFSVIVPTKNRPVLLTRAIESVLSQTFKDFELIIINDHSDYDVEQEVKLMDDDRIKVVHPEGEERSAARNKGIDVATGKYICFLDDDDEYLPNYLFDFYSFYENNNRQDCILRTGFQRIRDNKILKAPNYEPGKNVHPVHFFAGNMCGVWSLCIPRDYLDEDRFPVDFPHWQDTHLILRLLAKHPFFQLDSYNYNYHIHLQMGSSMAMKPENVDQRLQLNLDAVNHLFDHYGELLNPFLHRNMRNKIIAGKYLHFASGVLSGGQNSKALEYLKKSVTIGIYPKYWRYYVYIIKSLLFSF